MEKKFIQYTVKISPRIKALLDQKAKEKGLQTSEYVRYIISRELGLM